MATWTQPKTDWKDTDYINVSDLNRIRDNLLIISSMARSLSSSYEEAGYIRPNAFAVTDYPYAEDLNGFESRLDSVALVVGVDYGQKETFYDYGPYITARELNRIESATQDIKERLDKFKTGVDKLAIVLGLNGTAVRHPIHQ